MAHIGVKIPTLSKDHKVKLFDLQGEECDLALQFSGQAELARGEHDTYRASVPPGAYWLLERDEDGRSLLSRVTANDGAEASVELMLVAGGHFRDADVVVFAGDCQRYEVPDRVAQAFLKGVGRVTSKHYLAARRH